MIIVKESCKCGDADAHKFVCYCGCMEKVDQGKQYLRIRDVDKYLSDPDFAKIYVGLLTKKQWQKASGNSWNGLIHDLSTL